GARCLVEIEMQVAVADVTVDDESAIRDVRLYPFGSALEESRQRRDGDRDVVFEARAVDALCLGDRLSYFPERRALALVARQCGVEYEVIFQCAAESLFHHGVERVCGT